LRHHQQHPLVADGGLAAIGFVFDAFHLGPQLVSQRLHGDKARVVAGGFVLLAGVAQSHDHKIDRPRRLFLKKHTAFSLTPKKDER
jgi:hypothetical protein